MEWSLRWDMMNSLRNNNQLKGKTKLEIIELLGEPESKFIHKSEFYYNLGYSKHGINTGRLSIIFNEHDRVIDYSFWEG